MSIFLLCPYRNFVAPFCMQLIKLLQVFDELVGFYQGAGRNVLFLVHTLMHGVGKGSIANNFEFRQRLQGHGKQSELLKNILLLRFLDHHQASVASGQMTKLGPRAKGRSSTCTHLGNGWCTRRKQAFYWQLDRKSLELVVSPA
ncbi:uncharacterized protein TNCV_1275751 [Trichonephila clavipes]|nr:uncharacterized protein TNCV_1275751 [Trichonephila clavipes]